MASRDSQLADAADEEAAELLRIALVLTPWSVLASELNNSGHYLFLASLFLVVTSPIYWSLKWEEGPAPSSLARNVVGVLDRIAIASFLPASLADGAHPLMRRCFMAVTALYATELAVLHAMNAKVLALTLHLMIHVMAALLLPMALASLRT